MKKFLLGVMFGLFIGWVTVPLVKAAYSVSQSDSSAQAIPARMSSPNLLNDDTQARTYKEFLRQILFYMKQMNDHLLKIELNTQDIKDKIHA